MTEELKRAMLVILKYLFTTGVTISMCVYACVCIYVCV